MGIQVEPNDFQPCPRCGEPTLLVAYWDEKAGKVGEVFVDSLFEYPFTARDFKARLVVHEIENAMASRHDLNCRRLPPAPETEDEPPPYQGSRSRRR